MSKKHPDIVISQLMLPSSWEEPREPLFASVLSSSSSSPPSSGGADKGHSHSPLLCSRDISWVSL